jgi:hypothetical protein
MDLFRRFKNMLHAYPPFLRDDAQAYSRSTGAGRTINRLTSQDDLIVLLCHDSAVIVALASTEPLRPMACKIPSSAIRMVRW